MDYMLSTEEKIQYLKTIGLWDSIEEAPIMIGVTGVSYELWDTGNEKVARLFFEFKPGRVMTSKEANLSFLSKVMDCVLSLQERVAADLPDKIFLLDIKNTDNI